MSRVRERAIPRFWISAPTSVWRAAPVAGLVAAMAVAAFFRLHLPFTPVPVTFQTLVVLMGCALLDPKRATISQALYLGLGALGVPIVAGSAAGLALLVGPTGGYLVGFVAAGWLVSHLLGGRPASLLRATVAMGLGAALILACGSAYLMVLGFSPMQALTAGVVPFLLWDAVKAGLAAITYRLWVGAKA